MCVFGGGVGLLPNKCHWCMDVLLREHKVYADTVKLITNIKICRKRQKICTVVSDFVYLHVQVSTKCTLKYYLA